MRKAIMIAALAVLLVTLVGAVFAPPLVSLFSPQPQGLDVVREAWRAILSDFVEADKLEPSQLSQGAIEGLIDALDDPYSAYLDPEQYELSQSRLEGSFGGIGATFTMIDGQLTVIAPLEGTPAEREGILPGDKVLAIDGEPTQDMSFDEAVIRMRGDPGTQVTLRVLHEGADDPEDIVITRETIRQLSVSWEMLGDGIAHIKVNQFTTQTGSETVSALEEILAAGAEGIILDLRDNPGGVVSSAVTVASQFLDEGRVLSSIDNRGNEKVWEVEKGGLATDPPLAVLVNANSASSSEVLAGALQDYGRGRLIGTQTLGKGSINHLRVLSDGSAVYITIARWYTPHGSQIEGQGISPDEEVVITGEDREQGRDPQLERAIEYLKSQP